MAPVIAKWVILRWIVPRLDPMSELCLGNPEPCVEVSRLRPVPSEGLLRTRGARNRVKEARAAISGTPGAEETLRRDWAKAAHFYARFGVTQAQFRHGVQSWDNPSEDDPLGNRTAAGPTGRPAGA